MTVCIQKSQTKLLKSSTEKKKRKGCATVQWPSKQDMSSESGLCHKPKEFPGGTQHDLVTAPQFSPQEKSPCRGSLHSLFTVVSPAGPGESDPGAGTRSV
jgi:hypothetical protein